MRDSICALLSATPEVAQHTLYVPSMILFKLRQYGLNYTEIGTALGMNPSAVRTRLHRLGMPLGQARGVSAA